MFIDVTDKDSSDPLEMLKICDDEEEDVTRGEEEEEEACQYCHHHQRVSYFPDNPISYDTYWGNGTNYKTMLLLVLFAVLAGSTLLCRHVLYRKVFDLLSRSFSLPREEQEADIS